MSEHQNDQNNHQRHGGSWWTVAAIVLAAAVTVNVVVIDASQIGFLIPIFVAGTIALYYENRGSACGRRHAK